MNLTKDKLFKILLITTILAFINLICFITLNCLNIVETNNLCYPLLVVFFLLIWFPLFFKLIFKINFNPAIVIFYEIFMFLSIVVGSVWQVYEISNIFDKVVHFTSGIFLALLFYNVIYNKFSKQNKKLNSVWLFIFVFSFAMMIGGIWEIYEFVVDELFNQNMQRWSGFVGRNVLSDTMLDMIVDFVGAIIGGFISVIIEQNHNKKKELLQQ